MQNLAFSERVVASNVAQVINLCTAAMRAASFNEVFMHRLEETPCQIKRYVLWAICSAERLRWSLA
jgi:hypothetical protein